MTHVFRFFLPDGEPAEAGTERALAASDARRAERVLRLREDEPVEVADALGRVFAARMRPDGRVLVERLVAEPPPPAELAVRLALTGPRADTAVEKLVELGVERIGPLETELKRRDARTDRWQRIAAAAAAQAKRPRVPAIEPAIRLAEALVPGAVLLSHEQPDGSLDDALARAGRPLVLLVGPEGGFSDAEHAAARAAGVPVATLGGSVLRTETAAIAAAVLALDRLGHLRPTMPA